MVVTNEDIDAIIDLIKKSKDQKEAKEKLMRKKIKLNKENINFIKLVEDKTDQLRESYYSFSEIQAKSILDLVYDQIWKHALLYLCKNFLLFLCLGVL